MKKKWLTLPIALIMAGSLAVGVGCGASKSPVVTVQDGYVYVDGNKTDIQVSGSGKSAFELWKEDNPSFNGTEEDWIEWLQQLITQGGEQVVEHKIIENGVFKGGVTSGSATTLDSAALKLSSAILRLSESVILPVGENGSWEVNVTGKLLTSGSGSQFLVANPFTDTGRVYFGVNSSSRMLYLGVRLNETYVNYGWQLDSSLFSAKHSYTISYEGGIYYLSVDGGQKQTMSHINFNQANQTRLGTPEADAENLNGLIRTVLGQDYIEMTNIGATSFACNAEISDFTVKTSAVSGYRHLLSHPLAGTRIFYLGSSITYGAASGGVAFGEIINKISGNPFAKEAVSGTTLINQSNDSYVYRLQHGALNFAEKPDFLVVQLSTNDFSTNKPLGTVKEGTKSSDFDPASSVSDAIQYIIAYAKEQCPTVKVVFYAGAVKGSWGYRDAYETYLNGDFAKICEKWGIGTLDIFHSKYKSYDFYWNDDIHPKIEGYAAGWTPLFVKYLEENL